MYVLHLALWLSTALYFGAQLQPRNEILPPELIEGPWETANGAGIDGIFFQIHTSATGTAEAPEISSQNIDIRVYHRQELKETLVARFTPTDNASMVPDGQSSTLFDGRRLRIHFDDASDLNPFDLDITYSPTAHNWMGTWTRPGQDSDVVLARPKQQTGSMPSAFVGDWDGVLDSKADSPASLHVRQSSDGMLSAWLDRTDSGTDPKTNKVDSYQRNGEFLRVYSMPGTGFILETSPDTGPAYHFRGKLSADLKTLTGHWSNGSGGELKPEKFHRDSL